MTVEQAIEVFVRGCAYTRGRTHPCVSEAFGAGIWALRDAPRRRAADYRSEEYVAHGIAPARVDETARGATRGTFRVCHLVAEGEDANAVRAEYRALGYRLGATEPLMYHPLRVLPPERGAADAAVPVFRVATPAHAALLAAATRRRPRPDAAADDPLRQYVAVDRAPSGEEQAVGWVGSVAAAGCAWCASMYVRPEYRRRGIATALLARMLADDRESGARASVLLASHAGSRLYPTVGYLPLGVLLVYTPPRK